jgi:branched-chain amino acid transport system ATP-binding protein
MSARGAALSVRALSKSFGGLAIAQSIDLELERGARVGLIGPNGAGKTTLVNLLTGTLGADAGSIWLEGAPIERLAPEARVRRGLARTHQLNTLLPEMSARENVALAIAERERLGWLLLGYGRRWRACLKEADVQLEAIGAGGIAGRRVAELSYGEQRSLEIAIALALKPRVLLLDEPAAGVPQAEAQVIHQALERLPAEVAILMIEHDMDLVFRFVREIVVLVQGRILRRGVPAEIAADPEVRAVYLGRSRI